MSIKELFEKDISDLKKPSFIISVLQAVLFIVLYDVLAIVCTLIISYLLPLLYNIPIIGPVIVGRSIETITQTLLPITIGYSLYEIMKFIFRKYYFNALSVIVDFMFISYIVGERLMYMFGTYGLLSYEFGVQVWFSVLLCGTIFIPFYARSGFHIIHTKKIPDSKDPVEVIEDKE